MAITIGGEQRDAIHGEIMVEPIEQHRETLRTVTAQAAYAGLLAEIVESASGTTGVHRGDHDFGHHACGPSRAPRRSLWHMGPKAGLLDPPLQVVVRLRGQRAKHFP